jgi:hypothetical protein
LELQLTIDGRAVLHDDVLARSQGLARAGARETQAGTAGEELESANLYAVAEQLAAASATRRQYAAIYRSFGDGHGSARSKRCVSSIAIAGSGLVVAVRSSVWFLGRRWQAGGELGGDATSGSTDRVER